MEILRKNLFHKKMFKNSLFLSDMLSVSAALKEKQVPSWIFDELFKICPEWITLLRFIKLVFHFLPSNCFRFAASPMTNRMSLAFWNCYQYAIRMQLPKSLAFCYCCAPGLHIDYKKRVMHGNSFIVSRLPKMHYLLYSLKLSAAEQSKMFFFIIWFCPLTVGENLMSNI